MDKNRNVEQIEIIEHHITEGRRPLTAAEAYNYIPSSETRTHAETFLTSAADAERILRDEAERRFQLTGERDVSNTSFRAPSGLSPIRDHPLHQSTPDRSYSASAINSYGYDVHEVQTSGGGARVVESRGGGRVWDPAFDHSSSIMNDRSLDTAFRSPLGVPIGGSGTSLPPLHASFSPTAEHRMPQSILKNSAPHSSEENSLTRKDSYKRMQENQDVASVYAPSSQATMISRNSKAKTAKWSFNQPTGRGDFCLSVQSWWNNFAADVRAADKTPTFYLAFFLLFLFLLFLLILFVIFLNAAFSPYTVSAFLMYPPVCEECLRRNPAAASERPPSKLFVHVKSPSEMEFEIVGNLPLKSNSYTVVDFESGYMAIADHILTDQNRQHTTCFLMKIDRDALPNMGATLDAVANTYHEVHSQFGWQEHWQYIVKPIDRTTALSRFHSSIYDCQNAKWFSLEHSVYTRDSSCSECYDFCFPDYAVERRQKYEDNVGLTIRRLNCFRHFVPEWVNFGGVESDEQGGHFHYPQRSAHDTQRDAYGNWVNWTPIAVVGRPDRQRFREEENFDTVPFNSLLEPRHT